jgi:hypothetical protein
MFTLLRRRRQPTAAEIIHASIVRRDYKTVALFVTVGGLEVLSETLAELPERTSQAEQLRAALARVTTR